MKSNLGLNRQDCPKCQSQDTTKNGTVPGKSGRIQRFRCNNCKHIWNNPIVPSKQVSLSRASKSRTMGKSVATHSTSHSSANAVPNSSSSSELKTLQNSMNHHRKLELDVPLDWSPIGLLNFARAAQHNLLKASMSYDQSGQAELEWNTLSPELKTYIRARQHLDFALLLQLSIVFATPDNQLALPSFYAPPDQKHFPTTPLEPANTTRVSKTDSPKRNQKQRAKKPIKQTKSSKVKTEAPQQRARQTNAKSQSESPETNANLSSSSTEDPERKSWLDTLTTFQEERQQWSQERDHLLRSVRDLEQSQSQNQLRITSVTHDFERLKKQVLESKPVVAAKSAVSTTPSSESPQNLKARESSSSSSKRVMPPKYTATQEADLERLSSSLMANLVRLDGHQVRGRDIPHITGERGPWKAVLEHLMTLGKIQRQGEFIAITLVERLRRGLQSSSVKSRADQNPV
jgi:hypothetical protein